MDGGRERRHREKIIRHLIDVVSGQDVIMPGVAQSSPILRTPAYYRQLVNKESFSYP